MLKGYPLAASFFLLAFYSFSLLFAGELHAQNPEMPYCNSHFARVDSVTFHYRSWNDSLVQPKGRIVLIHGFMGSTFSWRENAETLAGSGYRVIAVDLAGFGYSDRNPAINQSQSNRARLLWDLLRVIGHGDSSGWNLVGHSMGGGTVEAMAIMHPERTRSLTIVDGMVFMKNENLQGAFVTASKNKQYNKVVCAAVEKKVFTYSMIERLLHKNFGYDPDSSIVMGYLNPLLIDSSAESVLSVFSNSKEIMELDVKNLEKLPVLVIWGKDDRTISLGRGERFVKNVPSAEMKIIPGCRHDPMEADPAVFNECLAKFLNLYNH